MNKEDQLRDLIDLAPSHIQRHFACDCAERALKRFDIQDRRCWNTIQVARQFAEGKASHFQLDDAWETAWSIARKIDPEGAMSSCYAARDTAQINARAAARSAAWISAWGVARYTIRYSEVDIERNKEFEWQIARLQHLLDTYNTTRVLLLHALQQRSESIKSVFMQYAHSLEERVFE